MRFQSNPRRSVREGVTTPSNEILDRGGLTAGHVGETAKQFLLAPVELSPNFGDGGCGSGGGGCGLTVGRLGDDLDPIVECHTKKEFWQLVLSVETTPTFLCAFKQFEDHCERGPVGQTALRSDRAVAHRGEGAFNKVCMKSETPPPSGHPVAARPHQCIAR
jgi:hypothetical protein